MEPSGPTAAPCQALVSGSLPLTALSETQRAAALARFHQLQPALEDGVPVAALARELGLTARTAQRWAAQYRRAGLVGLARPQRSDRGRPRLPNPVRAVIEGLALQRPRRPVAAIQRQAAALAAEHGWPIPTYRQTSALVHQLAPGLALLAHAGAKAHAEQFDLLYRREASHPNALWQADYTPWTCGSGMSAASPPGPGSRASWTTTVGP